MTRHDKLVQALLALALLHEASAHRPGYELLKWQENKHWWWSSGAPLTRVLNGIPEVVTATEVILQHFEALDDSIHATFEDHRRQEADFLSPCQSPDRRRWPTAIRSNFGVHGLPDPDTSCVTDFSGTRFAPDEEPAHSVDQLYEATLRRGLAIKANIKAIISGITTNFTDPDFVFNYPYHTTTASCVLHPVNAVRLGDRWRLGTAVHNRPISEALPLFGRRKIIEFARVADGQLTDNLLMRVPERPDNGTERMFHNDTTTLIVTGRGRANPSLFRFVPIWENPAITEILKKASRSIHQAENAGLPSNIAILVLPLVLNVIPISLFAPVSVTNMLIYMLVSDILTVIPLLLRGVELLRINTPYRSVVTRLSSSSSSTRSEAAAGEMWAAECRIGGGTTTLGAVLLSISVGFLIGGIVLELAARVFLQRRNRRLRKLAESHINSSFAGKQETEGGSSQAKNENGGQTEPDNLTTAGDQRDVDTQVLESDRIESSEKESNLRRRKGKQAS